MVDLLEVDGIALLEKDPALYPGFEGMRASMRAQLVASASAAVTEGGFPALFSSRVTFVDAPLAPLYGLDPATLGESLTRVELGASDPRVGVLGAPGFLAMHAYPGKTSPALRGLFVRKHFLCQEIPPPPPGIDTQLPESADGRLVTTRELVAVHQRDPSCAGCHSFMDPIGLGLEHFDAIGAYRETQNALPIDASGDLDGRAFEDAAELAIAVSEHEALMPCMSARLVAFGAGSTVRATDRDVSALATGEASDVREILRAVARSELMRFAWVSAPSAAESTGGTP